MHSFLDIIVVENSGDLALEGKALVLCPAARVVQAPQGSSYCDLMNTGIGLSRGEHILCLNDDVTLDPAFLENALKGFTLDPRIGMVTGKVLRQDRTTLDTTGLFLGICRTAQERGYGQADRGQFQREGFIFGVCGAAAFYRKTMLDEIREGQDWFDPRYRFFYEDLDIAWRAQRRGWNAYYIPDAVAYHVRGGSIRGNGGQGKPFARKYLSDEMHAALIRNRYRTIMKNETLGGLILHLIPIILYELWAWAYIIFFRPNVVRVFVAELCSVKGLAEYTR